MFITSFNSKVTSYAKPSKKICRTLRPRKLKSSRPLLMSQNLGNENFEKNKLEAEKIHFQGPPSIFEIIIPTLSILTVIGIIPFIATLTRQFWVNYKITSRRISVNSGFQGNDKVEIVYRDIKKINYITRFGGKAADVVLILKDNAQLELRSLPEWEDNLEFIKNQCDEKVEIN